MNLWRGAELIQGPVSLLLRVVRQAGGLAMALAGLVWPVSCAGCGGCGAALCQCCARALDRELYSFSLPALPVLPALPALGDRRRAAPGAELPVWAVTAYGGIPARLIVAWKEHGRHDLSRPLGRALARAVRSAVGGAGQPGIVLVPMPARRSAVRQRGADLPRDLARAAARSAGIRVVPALRHTRRVRDQVGLPAQERQLNVTGALAVRPHRRAALAGRHCLIVDDIVTTGASAREAARALTQIGAQVVGVCCLSVTFKQQGVLMAP